MEDTNETIHSGRSCQWNLFDGICRYSFNEFSDLLKNVLHFSLCNSYTVLVKSFEHLNRIFFLASLEEIGKLWKWWTVYKRRQFTNWSFHTPPCSKLAPLSQGGHRKFIVLNVQNVWPALYNKLFFYKPGKRHLAYAASQTMQKCHLNIEPQYKAYIHGNSTILRWHCQMVSEAVDARSYLLAL